MGLMCLFGHKWVKRGGPKNLGDGRFEQTYVCTQCKKIKVIAK